MINISAIFFCYRVIKWQPFSLTECNSSGRWRFMWKKIIKRQQNYIINNNCSVSSTETDINTPLAKAWSAIDKLSVIWKSDLTDKIKRSFFQAAVVSILLYGCTTWTLTKRMEKKLDGNYTRMLRTKKVLEAAPHKAAAEQSPATYHENYRN